MHSMPENICARGFGLMATLTAASMSVAMGLSGIVADLFGRNLTLMYTASGLCVMFVI